MCLLFDLLILDLFQFERAKFFKCTGPIKGCAGGTFFPKKFERTCAFIRVARVFQNLFFFFSNVLYSVFQCHNTQCLVPLAAKQLFKMTFLEHHGDK